MSVIGTSRYNPNLNPNPNSYAYPSAHLILKADLATLRAYESRQDLEAYVAVLREVLEVFGKGIHESLSKARIIQKKKEKSFCRKNGFSCQRKKVILYGKKSFKKSNFVQKMVFTTKSGFFPV